MTGTATRFEIPTSALPEPDVGCTSTAPDLWTVPCTLPAGHHGPHRNNQVTWRDQPTPDLATDSVHWVDGNVLLTDDEPPL